MEEKLEIIAFGAIPFVIDRDRRTLKQFNKPNHIIRFDQLKAEDGYYLARFDKKANYLSTVKLEFENHSDQNIEVYIPAPIIDSRELLSEEFKQTINTSSKQNSWGFYLGDKATALRLSGALPHIDLAGTDFTIDWRLRQLRETEEPWKHISFDDLEMDDSCEAYLCFYNTQSHKLFSPEENIIELPEDVVLLEIPNELKLDPVAVARDYGISETDFLVEHLIQSALTAKVTPLSESGLPRFIENNIKNLDNQKKNEERKLKRGR